MPRVSSRYSNWRTPFRVAVLCNYMSLPKLRSVHSQPCSHTFHSGMARWNCILHPVSSGINSLKNSACVNHLACIYFASVTYYLGPCISVLRLLFHYKVSLQFLPNPQFWSVAVLKKIWLPLLSRSWSETEWQTWMLGWMMERPHWFWLHVWLWKEWWPS